VRGRGPQVESIGKGKEAGSPACISDGEATDPRWVSAACRRVSLFGPGRTARGVWPIAPGLKKTQMLATAGARIDRNGLGGGGGGFPRGTGQKLSFWVVRRDGAERTGKSHRSRRLSRIADGKLFEVGLPLDLQMIPSALTNSGRSVHGGKPIIHRRRRGASCQRRRAAGAENALWLQAGRVRWVGPPARSERHTTTDVRFAFFAVRAPRGADSDLRI